jgi:hypothetical protein
MDEEFVILLFCFGISLTANVALAVAAWRAGRRARRLENHLLGPQAATPLPPGRDDGRVERVEEAIDALDARLAQLARGQDFLSKLLSERRHLPAAGERAVTPH